MFKMQIKKLIRAAVFLIFLSAGVFAQERTWNTFSLESKNWSILAPGLMKPDTEALKVKSNKGSHTYSDATGFFAVIYRDAPKRRYLPWKFNIDNYYLKTRQNAVKAVKGELVSDEEFKNGNIAGREILIKMPSVSVKGRETQTKSTYRIERARMFFYGKRFYVLLLVLPEELINTDAANNYFASFTLK